MTASRLPCDAQPGDSTTQLTQEDLNRVGAETAKYCAIAKLFSQAGTDLTVNWVKTN